uniref:Uncharacterized protein n=1 Tax=Knipowitschia caucasica TaxID=637954 RepID=A0AAV2K786_KNICA
MKTGASNSADDNEIHWGCFLQERGREGDLETPGAEIWTQMSSRWERRGGSWRDSPRTEMPGGSWLAAYVPNGTTGEDEMR